MKFSSTESKFFIIIDFNASKRYSHHWTYVKNYANFISALGYEYEILIPENSDFEVIKELGRNVECITRSNVYGYSRKESLYHWSRQKIINLIIDWVKYRSNELKLENFKELVARIYLSRAYRRIKKLGKNYTNLHLVFPTTDSLALRVAKLCLENKANIEAISFRAMGTNLKDNLSIKSAEVFYKNLLTNFPSCKIRIGFETFSYKSELLESGIPSDKICWAPAPSFYRQKRENIESKTLVLGFLGSARPNKGFENIPRLLQAMSDSGFSFQVIVQKAVYPWPAYTSTLQILSKWEGLIEFIPENISQNALEDLIAKVNVLVMPYRKEDYKIAGSGLLFIASDYSTPILSTKGVAFEWDIVTYSLGSTYSSESEFIDELTEICNSEMTFDFSGYNHNRNLAVREFLLF